MGCRFLRLLIWLALGKSNLCLITRIQQILQELAYVNCDKPAEQRPLGTHLYALSGDCKGMGPAAKIPSYQIHQPQRTRYKL